MPKVIDAKYAGKYRVWLRVADGLSGEIDLASELWGGDVRAFEGRDPFCATAHRSRTGYDRMAQWGLSPQWLHDQLKAQKNAAAAV